MKTRSFDKLSDENEGNKMLHVIVTVEIVDGARDAFLDEFHKIVPVVLQEEGCIEYGPTVDSDTGISIQAPIRTDTVTIIEKWENNDALKAHLVAPHMVEYRPKVKDFVANSIARILEPA